MKYISHKIRSAIITTILLAGSGIAQDNFWQSCNGPSGSDMTNSAQIVVAQNGNIIVSDYGPGIFISTDVGETWENISKGLPTLYISTMAIDSSATLWVGTNAGIFNSTNYGKNWSDNLTGDSITFGKGIVFNSHGYVFAGTYNFGIIKSTNGGKTWTRVNNGLPGGAYGNIFITKKDVLLVSQGGGEGVFRSTDEGDMWVRVGFKNPSLYAMSFIELPTGDILSFSSGSILWRSSDAGLSWNQTNAIMPAWMYFRNMQLDNYGNIYAGGDTNSGLAVSTDNGENWQRCILPNGLIYFNTVALAYSTNLGVLCGTDKGMFYSANQGKEWKLAKLIIGSITNLLANAESDVFAKSTYGSFRSTDLGTTWAGIGLSPDFVEKDGNLLSHSGNKILRSTDKGNTWISLYSIDPITSPVVSNSKGVIFSSTFFFPPPGVPWRPSGLICSTDNGANWKLILNDFRPLIMNVNSSGAFFAAISSSLYRTTDNQNWVLISNGPSGNINCIANDSAGSSFVATTNGLYASTNNGDSWSSLNLTGTNINSVTVDRTGNLFAVSDRIVYRSTDIGMQWTPIISGLPNSSLKSTIATPDGFLYIGTVNGGIYRSKAITTKVSKDNSNNVTSFILSQNYPNPFNPLTTINFSIPHRSLVSLKVFNSLGEEVAILIDEELEAGNYSSHWNAATFSSGIYFYRLQSEWYKETKRLLLLK